MRLLIRYELLKTFRKWRTYIGFLIVFVLAPLIYWGLSVSGDNMIRNTTRGLQNNFLFVGTLFNGWFVSHMVMHTLYVHIPFLILLVSADIFAGEGTAGTYRILLSRPPSRTKIFLAKLLSTSGYVFLFLSFIAVFTIGLGLIWFGGGNLLAMHGGEITIFPANDVWWRFLLAYALAAWAMCTVATLGLLFSTFVENAIGPLVGSLGLIIVMLIIGNLPYDFFSGLRPYLLTTYITIWQEAFHNTINTGEILRQAGILGIFFSIFSGAAWLVFSRKDILS